MSECNGTPPDRVFAALPRIRNGVKEELRVGTGHYKGHEYATVRVWSTGYGGEMVPTKIGINVQRNELIDVLRALEDVARAMGLLPPDEPSADTWRGYGGDGGPGRGPRPATPDTQLFAGQGRRRVDLSEACRSAAFEMLLPKREDD